jgi:hypothetical protein
VEKKRYATKAYIDMYDGTDGCQACIDGGAHEQAYRERFASIMLGEAMNSDEIMQKILEAKTVKELKAPHLHAEDAFREMMERPRWIWKFLLLQEKQQVVVLATLREVKCR